MANRLKATDRSASASEQIALDIERHVVEQGLGPGDRLGSEAELAEAFRVSKPTLREALRRLASSRLISVRPGRNGGVFVARAPAEGMRDALNHAIRTMLEADGLSLEELLEARKLLEVPLAGVAARQPSKSLVSELRDARDAALADLDDELVQRSSDLRIHRAIAHASGNRVIASVTDWTVTVLEPRLKDFIGTDVDDRTITRQHARLIAAIEARDPEEAEEAMRAHLEYIARVLRRCRQSAPVPNRAARSGASLIS